MEDGAVEAGQKLAEKAGRGRGHYFVDRERRIEAVEMLGGEVTC